MAIFEGQNILRKQILPKTYFPRPEKNRFLHNQDATAARNYFDKHRPRNLSYLLGKRYKWMNQYLENKTKIIELGCGPGFGSYFYEKQVIFTDIEKHPWVDEKVDALNLPYEDDSVDAFICQNILHHVAHPKKLLEDMQRKLKRGGCVLIHEPELSVSFKLLLMATRHEGWSDEVDVFDDDQMCNDPEDPWSANNGIATYLFGDEKTFHENISGYNIRKNALEEFFIFLLSGGVIVQTKTVNLPKVVLDIIYRLDQLLIKLAPNIFALARLVVLEKI